MHLQPVQDKRSRQAFFEVPYHIYKDDPHWIPPLQQDLDFIFDEKRNPAFAENSLQRWILKAADGQVCGRIAAFTKGRSVKNQKYPAGGIGFFECINNHEAAFQLFDQAWEWLEARGAKAMDGPINFGERDRFWGLLVEGFRQPSYQENYNPPYYQGLFEAYGFQQYFQQETYEVTSGRVDPERMRKIAERATRHSSTTVKTFDYQHKDQFIADFVKVYNRAWEHFQDFKPLSKKEVEALFKQVKPVIEKDFLIFVYMEGYPAGFIFLLPDVNQIFQYFDGKLGIWEQLKFYWYMKKGVINKLKGVVMGIHPDFQNRGVDAVLIYNVINNVEHSGRYNRAELSWIGDFNPKMKAAMGKLNAHRSKVHLTYRKLFDPSLPFEPYTIN